MAIAVATTANSNTTGTSLTYSHTCSGDDRLLIVGVYSETDTITGVTYGGVSMTFVGKQQVTGVGRYVHMYRLTAPTVGANNVVISSSGSTVIYGTSVQYTGVSQINPVNNHAGGSSGVSTTFNIGVTNTSSANWIVCNVAGSAGDVLSNNADTVSRSISLFNFGLYDSGTTRPVGTQTLKLRRNSGSMTWGGYILEIVEKGIAVLDTVTTTETTSTIRESVISKTDRVTTTEIITNIQKTITWTETQKNSSTWINELE